MYAMLYNMFTYWNQTYKQKQWFKHPGANPGVWIRLIIDCKIMESIRQFGLQPPQRCYFIPKKNVVVSAVEFCNWSNGDQTEQVYFIYLCFLFYSILFYSILFYSIYMTPSFGAMRRLLITFTCAFLCHGVLWHKNWNSSNCANGHIFDLKQLFREFLELMENTPGSRVKV